MASVYLTDHNETIYNLIEEEPPPAPKTERYKSKHSGKVRQDFDKKKEAVAKTMGLPEVPAPIPNQFLKRRGGISVPRPQARARCLCPLRKPPVPPCPRGQVRKWSVKEALEKAKVKDILDDEKQEDKEEIVVCRCEEEECVEEKEEGKTEKKDEELLCICEGEEELSDDKKEGREEDNTKKKGKRGEYKVEEGKCVCDEVERKRESSPKKIKPAPHTKLVPRHYRIRYVDTRKGDRNPWLPSPNFDRLFAKQVPGEVPEYIQRRKKEAEKARLAELELKALENKPPIRCLTDEERTALINGLKTNWEEMQRDYQRLPVITDTDAKKRRKTNMERELSLLEKDINVLEMHPYIFVDNDQ